VLSLGVPADGLGDPPVGLVAAVLVIGAALVEGAVVVRTGGEVLPCVLPADAVGRVEADVDDVRRVVRVVPAWRMAPRDDPREDEEEALSSAFGVAAGLVGAFSLPLKPGLMLTSAAPRTQTTASAMAMTPRRRGRGCQCSASTGGRAPV
jgi:hypothetical protein